MRWLLVSLLLVVTASCQKQNLKNAKESLDGTWRVTEIYSEQKDGSGDFGDGRHWETGELGFITFSDNAVEYAYTRLGVTYDSTETWRLDRNKENEGFFKVEKYTLFIGNRAYDCDFGDATSDAEKNATLLTLMYETEAAEPNYTMTLEKL